MTKLIFNMEFTSKFVQLFTEIQTIQLKLTHDYTITFWFNRNNFVITKIHSLGIILGRDN